MDVPPETSAVVLVEGASDAIALETLARRRGRELAAEKVEVVPIGGAQALGKTLRELLARGLPLRFAGLCDAGEERGVRRALERSGLGADLTREAMEALGFFVCEPDLEGELIRALGADGVEDVLARGRDLASFRLPEAARVARTAARGPAPALLRKQRREDQVRAAARRGARPSPRPAAARPRPRACRAAQAADGVGAIATSQGGRSRRLPA